MYVFKNTFSLSFPLSSLLSLSSSFLICLTYPPLLPPRATLGQHSPTILPYPNPPSTNANRRRPLNRILRSLCCCCRCRSRCRCRCRASLLCRPGPTRSTTAAAATVLPPTARILSASATRLLSPAAAAAAAAAEWAGNVLCFTTTTTTTTARTTGVLCETVGGWWR